MAPKNKIGERFGSLTVMEMAVRDRWGHIQWQCSCDCGKTKVVKTGDLGTRVKSCGCEAHPRGDKNHKWKGGKSVEVKCFNPRCGNTKLVYPSHSKAYDYFFCNEKCKGEYRSMILRGKNNPRYKEKIKVNCGYCGKILEVWPCYATSYQKHFCKGDDCFSKWCTENYIGESNPNFKGGTPEMRIIRRRISASMRKAIRQGKAGRHWESLVDYSMTDLIYRLKSTIPQGYSWEKDFIDGKGVLHIDHKKPMSSFNFNTAEDEDFRQCFALENLQLLPAIENMKKSAKYEDQQIAI